MTHQIRLADELYQRIAKHAASQQRTTNAQIVFSLEGLFPAPAPVPAYEEPRYDKHGSIILGHNAPPQPEKRTYGGRGLLLAKAQRDNKGA